MYQIDMIACDEVRLKFKNKYFYLMQNVYLAKVCYGVK